MRARTLATIFAGTLLTAAAPPNPAAPDPSIYAKPQRLVALPDGRRMNIYCAGAGSPTVILEGGWKGSALAWRDIHARVAQTTRVCSYDRAGYGFSDIGPMPRTATKIAQDLADTLEAAGLRPPYILVGFSLGGLTSRLFVDRNREAIAGVLLVDPTAPHQAAAMAKVVPALGEEMKARPDAVRRCAEGVMRGSIDLDSEDGAVCVAPPAKTLPEALKVMRREQQLRATDLQTASSEMAAMVGASSDEVEASARPWGALPLIVLTAGRSMTDRGFRLADRISPADREKAQARWWELHEDITRLSTLGQHRLVPESSHVIPRDNPEYIVGAIDELVRNARSAGGSP